MNNPSTVYRSFRPLLLLLLATLILSEARGETLVVGTNQPVNFSLTVPTNQAVVIYGGRFATSTPDIYWRITQFEQLYLFRLDSMFDPILSCPTGHPNIFAGPLTLELFIPRTADFNGSWMSYQVLPLAGLKTLIIPSMATNRVEVPAGTNLRFVSKMPQDTTMGGWQLISGTARAALASDALSTLLDIEFSGPVTLEIANNMMDPRWYTFSLHSGAVQLLPAGVITASGANSLSVEESSDLANWSAAAVMLKGAAPKRFYRLKASQ